MPLLALNLSTLFRMAFRVLTLAEKPSSEGARKGLLAPNVLDEAVETARLELTLRKLQEGFPSGDPFLRKILGDVSAHERATALVRGSRLADPAFRRDLVAGGRAALERSGDLVIQLIRNVDPEVDATWAIWSAAEATASRASDLLAAARYRVHGDALYPDGTGTARVSFGALKGYVEAGRTIAPVTTLGDLFAMARDHGPYQLPAAWLAGRAALDLSAPLNVATTNDMSEAAILLDDRGDMVGVNFNSNRQKTDASYTETQGRLVAVHNAGVVELLRHIYHADRLLTELGVTP